MTPDERLWHEHQPQDDTYPVTMTINGITAFCVVSSMHLIEEKRARLRKARLRTSKP